MSGAGGTIASRPYILQTRNENGDFVAVAHFKTFRGARIAGLDRFGRGCFHVVHADEGYRFTREEQLDRPGERGPFLDIPIVEGMDV